MTYNSSDYRGDGFSRYCIEAIYTDQTMSKEECTAANYIEHDCFILRSENSNGISLTINSDGTLTVIGSPECGFEDDHDEEYSTQYECEAIGGK